MRGRLSGLRPRLTLLATGLVALVSVALLWLGWLLVGGVANAVPALPPGSRVRVGGLDVPAEQVSAAVGDAMRAEVLLAATGAVVSSEELLERVWDENADPFTTTVRVTVMTLRKKLGDPGVIETVVGSGYRVPSAAA